MIVGHKIEQDMTFKWVEAEVNYWEVSTRRVVTELHATKGWRVIRRERGIQRVRKLPSWGERRKATMTTFVRARRSGSVEKSEGWLESATPASRERAVLRHKVRRVEIQRAKNLAALAAS